MDWDHAYSLLEDEMKRFMPGVVAVEERASPEAAARLKRMNDWQDRYEEPADGACMHFAQKGTWPALSHTIACVVLLRITSALQFADFARGQRRRFGSFPLPPLADPVPMPEFWTFVLIDYWHFAGRLRWQALEGQREDEGT